MTQLEEQVQRLMRNHPDLFPTEAKFWAYLRGCLRRGIWEKSPLKFRAKADGAGPPPKEYTGRGRKGKECALTGEWTPTGKAEVDHVEGHVSLTCEEHILPYIIHLLAEGDQLQYVDKVNHKIKSHADARGITFEEAAIEKKVIAKMKLPKPSQDEILAKYGLPCNNDRLRKEGWRTLIERGEL